MRAALVADLSAIGTHEIVTTADARGGGDLPRGVELVTLPSGDDERNAMLDSAIADVDAVWLIGAEPGGCLEQLAIRVERRGRTLLGPGAAAIAAASNKAQLARRLGEVGVRHPKTRHVAASSAADAAPRD